MAGTHLTAIAAGHAAPASWRPPVRGGGDRSDDERHHQRVVVAAARELDCEQRVPADEGAGQRAPPREQGGEDR